MTRSFGDTLGRQAGIIDKVEIKQYSYNKNIDIAVVVASDGVYEVLSNE